jgi:GT2 family glycosyltransferase
MDSECSYVLLLNNDAVPTSGFLEPAVEQAESDPRVGLVSGKVLEDRATRKLWYAGGRIDFWRGKSVARGYGEIDVGQYENTVEVGFATGGLMLIKRRVLEDVGMLPEEYFFGQEEWDYSVAVSRRGYKLLYVPGFLVYHHGDGSHSNSDPKFVYNSYRNKLIFQQKYLAPLQWRAWFLMFDLYARLFARSAIRSLHSPDSDFEGILFALRAAIADHKKEGPRQMCEDDLFQFQRRLSASRFDRAGAPVEG